MENKINNYKKIKSFIINYKLNLKLFNKEDKEGILKYNNLNNLL
jgi:hypothetical protein